MQVQLVCLCEQEVGGKAIHTGAFGEEEEEEEGGAFIMRVWYSDPPVMV